MTHLEQIQAACRELIEARGKALIKGRARVDKDGDLICDGLSGINGSVHVIASSSGEYVLMEENAEFFGLSANRAHLLARALEKLAGAMKDECHCTGERDYNNKLITCDACDALREAAEIIGGKGI